MKSLILLCATAALPFSSTIASAAQPTRFRCTVGEEIFKNGNVNKTIYATEDFNDLSKIQRMVAHIPSYPINVSGRGVTVTADLHVFSAGSKLQLYVQTVDENAPLTESFGSMPFAKTIVETSTLLLQSTVGGRATAGGAFSAIVECKSNKRKRRIFVQENKSS